MGYYLNSARVLRTIVPLGVFSAILGLSAPLLSQEPKLRTTLRGHTKHARFLAFSPDGKTLASASGNFDQSIIKLWDVASGRNITTLKPKYPFTYSGLAFSPDGKTLASCAAREELNFGVSPTENAPAFLTVHA